MALEKNSLWSSNRGRDRKKEEKRMTKWKRTGEEEQQSAVSSCGKKRQMAERERAERRTSYTADILTAADARRERDEREGGRDRGRAGWHTLPLSLALCDAGLSYFLTALFDWLSFTFSPFRLLPLHFLPLRSIRVYWQSCVYTMTT